MNRGQIDLIFTFDICSNFEITEKAVSLINDRLLGHEDSFGNEIRPTWFLRADNQMKALFGDEAYLLVKHSSLWNELNNAGHEIAWHPHIYRPEGDGWALETRPEWLVQHLEDGHRKISSHFDISSVRMGEGYHSNECMAKLDDLGLRVDSTAMPNRKRDDDRKFNWIGTPDRPYRPSKEDYRISGEDNLDILEVPMTMVPVKASYDAAPLERYVDLAFHSHLMREGIEQAVRTGDILVTTTHPYELVPAPKHPLVSYDIGEGVKNLAHIIQCCKDANRPYAFITMRDMADRRVSDE